MGRENLVEIAETSTREIAVAEKILKRVLLRPVIHEYAETFHAPIHLLAISHELLLPAYDGRNN